MFGHLWKPKWAFKSEFEFKLELVEARNKQKEPERERKKLSVVKVSAQVKFIPFRPLNDAFLVLFGSV